MKTIFKFLFIFILINKVLPLVKEFSSNFSNYEIIKNLGEEAYSTNYKVYNRDDDNIYVIKKINIKGVNYKEIEALKNEFNKISKIDNEYIIKYYDSFIDGKSFNIVMEYCDETNLRTFIDLFKISKTPIKKEFILLFIYYLSEGLKEIHKNQIIHGNIKPENSFLTDDFKIKIGNFGIDKILNFKKSKNQNQLASPFYIAPEEIKGLEYNNKIDIWSFGSIIYELCTLEFFSYKNKNKKINTGKYGEKFQKIINLTLQEDPDKRSSAKRILEMLSDEKEEILDLIEGDKIEKLIREDPLFEKYLLRKAINSCLELEIFNKDIYLNPYTKFLKYFIKVLPFIPLNGFHIIFIKTVFYGVLKRYFNFDEKEKFVKDNKKILQIIENDLLFNISTIMDKKMIEEKTLKIYNTKNLEEKIYSIKDELISSEYITILKIKLIKTFNILLVGNTNVGKSTLINEFLKLPLNQRAKESTGGPTKTKDFTPYKGNYRGINYTLFDTNGITNKGDDSIEYKINSTEKEIKKRIKSKDASQLIHCIWYCFQGTNIQPSDGEFIKKLIQIYQKYSMPIIFVHTQTYSIGQSQTCKKGIKKYLKEIYQNESDIKSHLQNYINVLARKDDKDNEEDEDDDPIQDCSNNNMEPFGLDDLEKISRKEIQTKGFKSSYYEYIKEDIKPIIINGAFRLFFTEKN